MKASALATIALFAMFAGSLIAMAGTSVVTNGDFSDPVDLAGYITTGTTVWEPTGEFAQLETDGTFWRTLEQTFTIPNEPTLLSFDFAFSTEGTLPVTGFPDSFASSEFTTLDGDYLDLLVVDVYGVLEDPSEGIENITGATPIDVSYDPSVTIAGFVPFPGGTTFYGRVNLWLPNDVLGEEATLYFDLFDELDGFKSIAAVDNIYVGPVAPEPWIIEYRWSTSTSPPYSMTVNPDGSITLDACMEVRIENRGNADAFNVTAHLVDAPNYVTILDNEVLFGDIPRHTTQWSIDDFCIRVVCTGPTDDTVLWNIEWDDSMGNHHVKQNVPMFGP